MICRTSHRVILGEHDRSSNAEVIQTLAVGKVCIVFTQKRNEFSLKNSIFIHCFTVEIYITYFITLHSLLFSPIQVIQHPNYNSYTINNDITLIKLATPAQLNNRVSPVCLAATNDNFPGGMKCVTSGWGLTRYNGNRFSM